MEDNFATKKDRKYRVLNNVVKTIRTVFKP